MSITPSLPWAWKWEKLYRSQLLNFFQAENEEGSPLKSKLSKHLLIVNSFYRPVLAHTLKITLGAIT